MSDVKAQDQDLDGRQALPLGIFQYYKFIIPIY